MISSNSIKLLVNEFKQNLRVPKIFLVDVLQQRFVGLIRNGVSTLLEV